MANTIWRVLLGSLIGVAIAQAPTNTINTSTLQDAVLRGENHIEFVSPLPDWRVGLRHYQELLKLEQCESGGVYRVILDTNGLHSYGWLQWQAPSFRKYGVKYAFFASTMPQDELLDRIRDRATQFEIADRVLSEPNGIYNWFNCGRTIGLIP